MIITRLIGGLGNQFFQYAVGRHLAEIHKTEVKIDISGFESYKLHKYSLWPFNIQESFASPEEVAALRNQGQTIVGRLTQKVLQKPLKSTSTYIRERKLFCFDADILNLGDDIYLQGSWQNEKYFTDIAEIIRREFTVKTPASGKNKELTEQITSCESVGLHIRRGDYVSNPNTNKVHGTCDIDYYCYCVKQLALRVNNPYFFIFGDDPQWAMANLKLSYPTTLVGHNDADKNYEDMRLLSQCKHNITANSSFSWWAAWLNQNPEKIILAPERWLKNDIYDTKDLIPDGWIRV